MPAGRPPKPTAEHHRDGTYRPDRQGGRLDSLPWPEIDKETPEELTGDAAWLWDHIMLSVPDGVLKAADVPMLSAACDLWGMYQEAKKDKALTLPQRIRAAKAAWRECALILVQLGFSPAARARIQMGGAGGNKEANPIAALIQAGRRN